MKKLVVLLILITLDKVKKAELLAIEIKKSFAKNCEINRNKNKAKYK